MPVIFALTALDVPAVYPMAAAGAVGWTSRILPCITGARRQAGHYAIVRN